MNFVDHKRLVLSIADLVISCTSIEENLEFDVDTSVLFYLDDCKEGADYEIVYAVNSSDQYIPEQWSFVGQPEQNSILNYSWFIYNGNQSVVIKVEFDNHEFLKDITAQITPGSKIVKVNIVPAKGYSGIIKLDPLIHPLGSLLLLYLIHQKGGLLMHASAIEDDASAYLFTGVSGIGKSTMCRLWKECGANVINDDRVVLRLHGDNVIIYNNPMPYYKQHPVNSVLKSIFLLKQSPDNYIKPLSGVVAFSRVLGNFIQQFYDKQMVREHLEYIEKVLDKVEVFEVGFKPDYDIVKLIRNMD